MVVTSISAVKLGRTGFSLTSNHSIQSRVSNCENSMLMISKVRFIITSLTAGMISGTC